MSSSDLPREVFVCPSCGLRQFVGVAALCRRCREPRPMAQLEIPLAAMGPNLAAVIGNTIRELRLRRGFSQSTLAQRIGSHRTHVSRIERAQVTPTPALLVRAALALGVEQILLRVRA